MWANAVALLSVAGALVSCGGENGPFGNAPGANAQVGDIAIRYAHLEDPENSDSYPAGADVPFYVWLQNEGDRPVQLADVTSDLATRVSMTEGELPVELPVAQLVEFGPSERHFILEDITRQIRAQDLVDVTLTFSDGSRAELEVEGVEVQPAEMDISR